MLNSKSSGQSRAKLLQKGLLSGQEKQSDSIQMKRAECYMKLIVAAEYSRRYTCAHWQI